MKPVRQQPPHGNAPWQNVKGIYEAFLELRAHRPPDPFFQVSSEASDGERWLMARDRRAQARLLHGSAEYRVARIVVHALFIPLLLMGLGLCVPLGIQWLLNPSSGGALRGFLYSIGYAFLAWPFVIYHWTRNRRVTRTVEELRAALGGSWGRNQFLPFLDWLDANWPADTPLDELEPPAFMEQRWDIRTSYCGQPVLMMIMRRPAGRRVSPVRRISLYLSAPNASPPAGYDPAPALRELEVMGFWSKRTPAGVYACHPGISLELLERDRVLRVLAIARSIASGTAFP
jgi:hypothetical protein